MAARDDKSHPRQPRQHRICKIRGPGAGTFLGSAPFLGNLAEQPVEIAFGHGLGA
jgi:hypothetical protein